jgi:hypothetical protein
MRRTIFAVTVLGTLLLAAPAHATFHLLKINELAVSTGGSQSAQFVELLDPSSEPFPVTFAPYKLVVYDGAGNKLPGEQTLMTSPGYANPTPRLLATQPTVLGAARDEALTISLPAAAGQLCYANGSGPSLVDCLGWGAVSAPVKAGEPIGSAPPDGQSLDRCATGVQVAAPTPKAANGCASGGGGGGTTDRTAPKASLTAARPSLARLVAKGLKLTVHSNEAARVKASLQLLARTARKPPTIGSVSVRLRKAGSAHLTLKLSRSGQKRLSGVERAKLRVLVTVTDAAGNARHLSKRLTVVR